MTSKAINIGALTKDIDAAEIRTKQRQIDESSKIIDGVVDRLVAEFCRDLDAFILRVKQTVHDMDNPPTDQELDYFVLNLPLQLYYAGTAQESLGIREDMAKAVRMEIYNKVHQEATKTVADKNAAAELATQTEYLTQIAYQRAYKKIKFRIDAANELLQSIKKVVTRRVAEYEITRVGGN